MEKHINEYIGDIVGGLVKEAAYWKSAHEALKKQMLEIKKETSNQFIGTEDSQSQQISK